MGRTSLIKRGNNSYIFSLFTDADDCQLIADSGRRTLRSSDTAMFVVRRTNSTFGDQSFAVAGARIWNSLLSSLRSADLSTERFKRALKTFLFV